MKKGKFTLYCQNCGAPIETDGYSGGYGLVTKYCSQNCSDSEKMKRARSVLGHDTLDSSERIKAL